MTKKISRVAGIDLFVAARFDDELPKTVGAFSLKNVTSRGTSVTAKDTGAILDVGWVCARYLLAADKNMTGGALDTEITKLISEVGKGREWSSLVKLYEIDGTKAFSG
ncbi:MAG: hypothetical protein IOD12_04920 [Silvanigrellales bacterium]|jgi:hypothetical protein|nr:hypothetical protein [Silvanigrellales bacterium]